MGRWINKIQSQVIPTKPSKPCFVGFVGINQSHIQNFVTRSCTGLNIKPSIVISDLLSIEDEDDIINGDITGQQLHGFIQLWIEQGTKKVSGKGLDWEVKNEG